MYKKLGLPLLLMLGVFLSSCQSEKPSAKERPPAPVTASLPKMKDITVYIESLGTLEASFYLEICPQVSGVIENIFVKQGDWVQADAPLFQINSKIYEIKVKEARAQLLMDQASHDAAKKKWERYQNLAQKDLIAQIEWDEIQEQALRAKAILAASNARLEAAELDLEHCTLYAPADGRIGRYDLHLGTLISREQILTSISRIAPLFVNFKLTEKEFARLPAGPLSLHVQLLCEEKCNAIGKVTFLDSHFDERTGLIFMRGELQNIDQHLRPGQAVSVRIPIAVESQKLTIPNIAIKYNQLGPYVYVVSDENTLEFRQLILGIEEGEEIVVLEGISPTEPVVTSGHGRLSPGLKVEIKS